MFFLLFPFDCHEFNITFEKIASVWVFSNEDRISASSPAETMRDKKIFTSLKIYILKVGDLEGRKTLIPSICHSHQAIKYSCPPGPGRPRLCYLRAASFLTLKPCRTTAKV
jgi:hypothetical protein